MTLLTDIRNFFERERAWGVLFVVLLGVFALLTFRRQTSHRERPSEEVLRLHEAEVQLKEEIQKAGGVQKFMASRPKLLRAFNLFSFFVLAATFAGFILDYFWVMRPDWRRKLAAVKDPPEARSWSIGTVFKAILLFISAGISLSILLSAARSLFLPYLNRNLIILIHTTLIDIFCLGVILYFIRSLGGHWRDLGFKRVRIWEDVKVGLAGYAAILPIFLLVLISLIFLANLLGYEPPSHPLVDIFLEEGRRSPALVGYSIFLACVAGPFFEEIFFRGFCYPAFKKKWGTGWALVLSSAFFSVIHENTFALIPVFVLGLALAYLYEKRGTLMASMVLHMVHNSLFITYFFLVKAVLT